MCCWTRKPDLVLLPIPTYLHDTLARDANEAVGVFARAMGYSYSRPLEIGLLRRPGDPENIGIEPDVAYVVEAPSFKAPRANKDNNGGDPRPPDLVVEMGDGFFDREKQALYCELGIPEYWQINADDKDDSLPPHDVLFMSLQEKDRPERIEVSKVLPGLTPTAVKDCMVLIRQYPHMNYAGRIWGCTG